MALPLGFPTLVDDPWVHFADTLAIKTRCRDGFDHNRGALFQAKISVG